MRVGHPGGKIERVDQYAGNRKSRAGIDWPCCSASATGAGQGVRELAYRRLLHHSVELRTRQPGKANASGRIAGASRATDRPAYSRRVYAPVRSRVPRSSAVEYLLL